MRQWARADNLRIRYRKKQIDISFSCICPVIDKEFCHNIVKVVYRSYFDNVRTKFIINNRTDTWKTDVNLLNGRNILCLKWGRIIVTWKDGLGREGRGRMAQWGKGRKLLHVADWTCSYVFQPCNEQYVLDYFYLLDIMSRAKNGPSKSCALVGCGMKMIKHHFLQLCVNFLHFTQDNTPFSFNFCFTKSWILNDIC